MSVWRNLFSDPDEKQPSLTDFYHHFVETTLDEKTVASRDGGELYVILAERDGTRFVTMRFPGADGSSDVVLEKPHIDDVIAVLGDFHKRGTIEKTGSRSLFHSIIGESLDTRVLRHGWGKLKLMLKEKRGKRYVSMRFSNPGEHNIRALDMLQLDGVLAALREYRPHL